MTKILCKTLRKTLLPPLKKDPLGSDDMLIKTHDKKVSTHTSDGPIPAQSTVLKEYNEKDLGVMVDNQLKFHERTAYTINKANRILELIKLKT